MVSILRVIVVLLGCAAGLKVAPAPPAVSLSAHEDGNSQSILPKADLPDDEYYTTLRKTILANCGEMCQYTPPVSKGKFFGKVVKKDQCDTMFNEKAMALDSLSNKWPPSRHVPAAMLNDFTMGDPKMQIEDWFIMSRDDSGSDSRSKKRVWDPNWNAEKINHFMAKWQANNFTQEGSMYEESESRALYQAIMKHKDAIVGKHCVVVGSRDPWLEAMALTAGVSKLTTVEYGPLKSSDPRVEVLLPSEWPKLYHQKKQFDCMLSYSSIEHAGLGRYGDVINPWGDLMAMAKVRCTLKKGAWIFLGLEDKPEDVVGWNAHRYYGPKRWAQILANTEQVDFVTTGGSPNEALAVARLD